MFLPTAQSWFFLLYHFSFIFTCLSFFHVCGFPLHCASVSLTASSLTSEKKKNLPALRPQEWLSSCIQVISADCFQPDSETQTDQQIIITYNEFVQISWRIKLTFNLISTGNLLCEQQTLGWIFYHIISNSKAKPSLCSLNLPSSLQLQQPKKS